MVDFDKLLEGFDTLIASAAAVTGTSSNAQVNDGLRMRGNLLRALALNSDPDAADLKAYRQQVQERSRGLLGDTVKGQSLTGPKASNADSLAWQSSINGFMASLNSGTNVVTVRTRMQ